MGKKKKRNQNSKSRPQAAKKQARPEAKAPARDTAKKQARITKSALFAALVFPLAIFYCEFIFHLFISGSAFGLHTVPTLLFSLIYGGILFLLVSFIRDPKHRRIVTAVLLVALAVLFLVEAFIYRQFGMPFDLKTIFNGAAGIATDFRSDVAVLLFSLSGLMQVALFLLPAVLYLILPRWLPAQKNKSAKSAARALSKPVLIRLRKYAAACVLFAIIINAITIYSTNALANSYDSRYNFTSATMNFGLLTAFRLDASRSLFGRTSGFEQELSPAIGSSETSASPEGAGNATGGATSDHYGNATDSGDSSETTEKETVFAPSVLDIDFAALAESSSGYLAEIDSYVASLTPSHQNQYTGLFAGKNLIMITAEAFSAEVIDPVLTPTLYRLATKGINFTDYYQPASSGTTGGEFQNIFGLHPMSGGSSFEEIASNYNPLIMSMQLNALGYYGAAYHNNDYDFYNRGVTHNSLGYSAGYTGLGNGLEDYITDVWPRSDLEMMEATADSYIGNSANQPFNIYYMTVSGHSGYAWERNYMSAKNIEYVRDLDFSEPVKAYIAANIELEKALEYLVDKLDAAGIADDTVIVVSSDHFPYGLDLDASLGDMPYLSELYGHNVTDYIDRDHNRLIIWCGSLEEKDPIVVDTPTSSLDILPTLLNLFGLEWDSRLLPGRDVFSEAAPLVFDICYDWKTERGTYIALSSTFTPAAGAVFDDYGGMYSYVSAMNSIVANKLHYCSAVLETDYYLHAIGYDYYLHLPESDYQ